MGLRGTIIRVAGVIGVVCLVGVMQYAKSQCFVIIVLIRAWRGRKGRCVSRLVC